MLTAGTLGLLEGIFRVLYKNKKPMGGIQLVVVGDFCQLKVEKGYLFESDLWGRLKLVEVLFSENIRQKKDPAFYDCLEKIRYGRIDKYVIYAFIVIGGQYV